MVPVFGTSPFLNIGSTSAMITVYVGIKSPKVKFKNMGFRVQSAGENEDAKRKNDKSSYTCGFVFGDHGAVRSDVIPATMGREHH